MTIKPYLLFLLLFFLSIGANSQKVDSLLRELKGAIGKDKYEALYGLAYEYSEVNDSISLIYATQAYDLALSLGDSSRITRGARIKAGELRRLEYIDEAIQTASYALGIARRHADTSELKLLLNSLGVTLTMKAEYDRALRYYFETLVIRELGGDKKLISITQNNIGTIYYKLRDYNRALIYYKKSLQSKTEVNDTYDLDRLLINLGLCYNNLGRFEEAKRSIEDGFKVCGNNCSVQIIMEGELAIGVSFKETDVPIEALKHFDKSYQVAKKTHNYRFQAENLEAMARMKLEIGDTSSVESQLREAERLSSQKTYRFLLVKIYESFSKLYEKRGDYKNTAFFQSKYIAIRDSILSDKVISNLAQVRTQYEERENIKTIAEKDEVLTLQREIIVRQQRQYFFVVVITGLIMALAAMLFYFSKRQQKINRELSSAKNLIEEQNNRLESHNKELEEKVTERTGDLQLSNKALQKLNEELDYFIYKSSHDLRGPLVTLKGMCNIAIMDLKDPVAIDYFKKFDVTTDKLNVILTRLQTVNYLTHSKLRPEPINFKDLIEDVILFEKRKGMPEQFTITYDIEPGCEIVSDEFLVRTILENLIDNSVKFRSTSNRVDPFVKVRVTKENAFVKMTVEDNGIGIDKAYEEDLFKMFIRASEQSEIGGVGLYLIKLAVDKAGGEIKLIQSSGNGSIFQAIFPIDLQQIIDARNQTEKKLVELLEKQG